MNQNETNVLMWTKKTDHHMPDETITGGGKPQVLRDRGRSSMFNNKEAAKNDPLFAYSRLHCCRDKECALGTCGDMGRWKRVRNTYTYIMQIYVNAHILHR